MLLDSEENEDSEELELLGMTLNEDEMLDRLELIAELAALDDALDEPMLDEYALEAAEELEDCEDCSEELAALDELAELAALDDSEDRTLEDVLELELFLLLEYEDEDDPPELERLDAAELEDSMNGAA